MLNLNWEDNQHSSVSLFRKPSDWRKLTLSFQGHHAGYLLVKWCSWIRSCKRQPCPSGLGSWWGGNFYTHCWSGHEANRPVVPWSCLSLLNRRFCMTTSPHEGSVHDKWEEGSSGQNMGNGPWPASNYSVGIERMLSFYGVDTK